MPPTPDATIDLESARQGDSETWRSRPAPERPDAPGATARLHFRGFDRDRSGFLEGPEFVSGGGERADVMIALMEMSAHAAPNATSENLQ